MGVTNSRVTGSLDFARNDCDEENMKEQQTTDRYTLADLGRWSDVTRNVDPPIRLGIFGDPVAHSLSPQMQNAALRAFGTHAPWCRCQGTSSPGSIHQDSDSIGTAGAVQFGNLPHGPFASAASAAAGSR